MQLTRSVSNSAPLHRAIHLNLTQPHPSVMQPSESRSFLASHPRGRHSAQSNSRSPSSPNQPHPHLYLSHCTTCTSNAASETHETPDVDEPGAARFIWSPSRPSVPIQAQVPREQPRSSSLCEPPVRAAAVQLSFLCRYLRARCASLIDAGRSVLLLLLLYSRPSSWGPGAFDRAEVTSPRNP